MQKYRVVLIGCGRRGHFFPKVILGEPRCELVAICDLKQEAMDKAMQANEIEVPCYTDYKQMIREQNPDMAVVIVRTKDHTKIVTDLAHMRVKMILCEKPMAGDWGDARSIEAVVRETGVDISYCHQRRTAPGNLYVRKLIHEGLFGDIFRMDLFVNHHLMDCGTHTFDQAASYIGDSDVRWVLGGMDVASTINYFDVPAERSFVGTMMYENGVVGTVFCGLPEIKMQKDNRCADVGVRVFGTKGFAEMGWEGEILRYCIADKPDWKPEVTDYDYPLTNMITHILDCREQGKVSDISHIRARKAIETVFAFYESVRRREVVTLPLGDAFNDNPFETMMNEGFKY